MIGQGARATSPAASSSAAFRARSSTTAAMTPTSPTTAVRSVRSAKLVKATGVEPPTLALQRRSAMAKQYVCLWCFRCR
jgi:hypothetical protein